MSNQLIYYNKYLKYRNKYIILKNNLNIQRGGSKKLTFFIYSVFDGDKNFIELMKNTLINKGWKESYEFPVDFMFLYFSYKIEPPILDTNKSKLVNLIKGSTYENIINNELFLKKYRNEYFMWTYEFIDKNNIIHINDAYTLWPVYGKYLEPPSYPRKIVTSKDEIKNHIDLYPEYKKWMIRKVLTEPCLKNGYVFHLNFIFLITLPFKLYIYKKKSYVKSKIFDPEDFKKNPGSYKTYSMELDPNEYQQFFPEFIPDGWTQKQTDEMNELIENTLYVIFKNKIDIKPDNNSKNAYYIFNAFIRLHERLPPFIYYILNLFLPHLHKDIIPGLISILIDKKDHSDFKKIDIKKNLGKSFGKSDNFKYSRLYPLNRSIPDLKITKTFYIKISEVDFEEELYSYLTKENYNMEDNLPVDFIFLSGNATYYRNRFDTMGSNWINLLYGNSKTQITNKYILKKKYENSNFIINTSYVGKNKKIQNIDENTIKILKPLNEYGSKGIAIIKTKNEINLWINKNENNKYREWIIEDYLLNPDLINGYKFHLKVLILVKVLKNKQIEVYISEYKFITKANEKYKNNDWDNMNIHNTSYQSKEYSIFPKELPDNWNLEDVKEINNNIEQIIKKILKDQNDFQPEWNAQNGFEIFGANFIFSNKKIYLLEINSKISLKGFNIIIPSIIDITLHSKENQYLKKII